jgi:hypothetical protein
MFEVTLQHWFSNIPYKEGSEQAIHIIQAFNINVQLNKGKIK